MTKTPPPLEHLPRKPDLIDRGGHLTRWFITEITHFLAPQPGKFFGAPYLRWLLRHYFLPAEATLRRAIHLIAETLPPLQTSPSPKQTAHPRVLRQAQDEDAGRKSSSHTPRTPLFRITEPPPRPHTNYLPAG